MPIINIRNAALPPSARGLVAVGSLGVPRFWATIWSDVLNPRLEPSSRQKYLTAIDRFYEAVCEQHGTDCLDRLIAEADGDALEECLLGFFAQLRNAAVVENADKSSTWKFALDFATEMLRQAGSTAGARANEIQAKVHRLETFYRNLVPNPQKPPPPIRALPPLVIEDLYEIFRPDLDAKPLQD
ncbi:hypothetical protein [Brucella sp. JSBI001]|uniref:hypothetical protein n=1 Tax=Brucella sp. JSBI001 TaxID=2886044 RepID=UPI00223261B7|nr:hypothetical protein [Brucella sp. JSBI001]UZD68567.1 hypothetical protein LJ361_15645 [Brucella sp. JSBI001]